MPFCSFFFFNDTATTEIYTLSLHDALPIYTVAPLHRNLEQVIRLIVDGGIAPSDAFRLITSNPARTMKLKGKGELREGWDADITLFDDNWKLQGVYARGAEMMHEGVVMRKGNFEM